jgi:hypothetical protein
MVFILMTRIRKKFNQSHLAYDNINNLRDGDPPCQYPDEPARVPGAGGHSPQEILGLQGIQRAIYLYLTPARLVPMDFLIKLRLRHPVRKVFLNPFLPIYILQHGSCVIS